MRNLTAKNSAVFPRGAVEAILAIPSGVLGVLEGECEKQVPFMPKAEKSRKLRFFAPVDVSELELRVASTDSKRCGRHSIYGVDSKNLKGPAIIRISEHGDGKENSYVQYVEHWDYLDLTIDDSVEILKPAGIQPVKIDDTTVYGFLYKDLSNVISFEFKPKNGLTSNAWMNKSWGPVCRDFFEQLLSESDSDKLVPAVKTFLRSLYDQGRIGFGQLTKDKTFDEVLEQTDCHLLIKALRIHCLFISLCDGFEKKAFNMMQEAKQYGTSLQLKHVAPSVLVEILNIHKDRITDKQIARLQEYMSTLTDPSDFLSAFLVGRAMADSSIVVGNDRKIYIIDTGCKDRLEQKIKTWARV